MKTAINIEIELDDKYVEEWNENFKNFHAELYKSEEKGIQALKENPIENAIATEIEDYLDNSVSGVLRSEAKVIRTNSI